MSRNNTIGLAIIGAVIIGFFMLNRQPAEPLPEPEPLLSLTVAATETATPEPSATPEPTPTEVAIAWVYVSGAVQAPGVYALSAEGRINDAIAAAGGFNNEAAPEHINLAARIHDEQQIYIPHRSEVADQPVPIATPVAAPKAVAEASTTSSLVNINTATSSQLESLPKIGPATAQRIIEYRETNGSFKSIEDLQNVKGIGATTYALLAELISVD